MTKFNKTYLIAISGITLSWVCAFYLGYSAKPDPMVGGVNSNQKQKVTFNPSITDPYRVQVQFKEKDDKGIEYQDAIYFTADEFEVLTQEQLDIQKQERFNKWKQVIEEASLVESSPEPVDEQNP